jgi:hypothetical protein
MQPTNHVVNVKEASYIFNQALEIRRKKLRQKENGIMYALNLIQVALAYIWMMSQNLHFSAADWLGG